jgi:hypothetical protein
VNWNGVEWSGVDRGRVEWSGIEWSRVVWCGVVWYGECVMHYGTERVTKHLLVSKSNKSHLRSNQARFASRARCSTCMMDGYRDAKSNVAIGTS